MSTIFLGLDQPRPPFPIEWQGEFAPGCGEGVMIGYNGLPGSGNA